ncbi:MAG: hypothetical protein ABI459_11840 [Deltaproteobacteria bacterium]
MAQLATQALVAWLDSLKTGLPVSVIEGPADQKPQLALRLIGIEQSTSLNDTAARPLRVQLTYQLAVQAADPLAAHEVLCNLMFAGLNTPVLPGKDLTFPMNVASGAVSRQRFALQGAADALYFEVTVERARLVKQGPPVREPAILKTSTLN